jgi:hypothetical protein
MGPHTVSRKITAIAFMGIAFVLFVVWFLDMNIWNKPSDPLTTRQFLEGLGIMCCVICGRLLEGSKEN